MLYSLYSTNSYWHGLPQATNIILSSGTMITDALVDIHGSGVVSSMCLHIAFG